MQTVSNRRHSTRWHETIRHSTSLSDLQRAVKFNGPSSPCVAGCRSVCWKAFLLGQGSGLSSWSHALLESRSTYSSLRDHFLKYIKHPEYLANVSSDPLADDADVSSHAPSPSPHRPRHVHHAHIAGSHRGIRCDRMRPYGPRSCRTSSACLMSPCITNLASRSSS